MLTLTWIVLGAGMAGCRTLGAPVEEVFPTNSLRETVVPAQHVEPLLLNAADSAKADQKEPAAASPPPASEPDPQDLTLPPPLRNPAEEELPAPKALTLGEVTTSVYYAFPGLEAAIRELQIAAGKQQAAMGEFDLKLKAASQSDPLGFYQTYKNAFKVEQSLWSGGGLYGQYRLGRGNFPTWDGLETNDGGEFKVGVLRPLLQNRMIDARRADVFQATLRRQQVDPAVRALLLALVRDAADSYWSWVAAGRSYEVQRDLLDVTIERNKVYEGRVAAGDLPRIELVQNQRLIAAREGKLVEAERKLQQSAIKLSLYLRDEFGQPLMPQSSSLPADFPAPSAPDATQTETTAAEALASRPELHELDLIRQQIEVDLAQAQNLYLPDLSATLEAAQDVGGPTPKKDKSPFQLQAGLYFEVPLQRNKADGKAREARAKIAQLAAKRRLQENKIVVEVQDAASALETSYQRYLRAKENTQFAQQLVVAERERFEAQDSDLLRVALQETAAIEAALGEVEALADFYRAEAALRAAIAADPLQP